MANVSHEVPTIHPYMQIVPRGTPGHSREFAAHAGGEDGDRMLPLAIKVLAATAVEMASRFRPRRAGLGGPAHRRRRARAEAGGLSDILAGHSADEERLAELYDLEHDEVTEDLAFYREWAHRTKGPVVDLGCGSGRLFASLLRGGATRVVGIDGSRALLARARRRIEGDPDLRAAFAADRIELAIGDVRNVRRPDRWALALLAGVLAHLDGPEEAMRALDSARRLLEPDGIAHRRHPRPGCAAAA